MNENGNKTSIPKKIHKNKRERERQKSAGKFREAKQRSRKCEDDDFRRKCRPRKWEGESNGVKVVLCLDILSQSTRSLLRTSLSEVSEEPTEKAAKEGEYIEWEAKRVTTQRLQYCVWDIKTRKREGSSSRQSRMHVPCQCTREANRESRRRVFSSKVSTENIANSPKITGMTHTKS